MDSPFNSLRYVMDIEHYKLQDINDLFYKTQECNQTMKLNNSSNDIDNGSRYSSYVSESVQQEVDGIWDGQVVSGIETLKESSLPDDDIVEALLSEITPQLCELVPLDTLNLEDINNATDRNSTQSVNVCEGYSSDSLQIFVTHDITQKDGYQTPSSLLAESPSDMKRKPVELDEDLAPPPTLATKKRCLYEQAPFHDKVKEKRRKDALRAKRNRDNKRNQQFFLEEERAARVKLEREVASLKKQVEDLKSVIEHCNCNLMDDINESELKL